MQPTRLRSVFGAAGYDGPMPTAWILAPVTLAIVLGISGVAKLREGSATLNSMKQLGLGRLAQPWLAAALPWGEIALAAALLVLPGVWGTLAAVAALALFAAYWLLIARALREPAKVNCGCFGKTIDGTVTTWTLARNSILVALAALTVAGTLFTAGVLPGLIAVGTQAWWLVGAFVIAALVFVTVRPEDAPAAPIMTHAVPMGDEDDEPLFDYQRAPIPFASLQTPDGSTVTLRDMAFQQARLLLFVSTTCGGCAPVRERLAEWTAAMPQIGVHAVYTQKPTVDGDGIDPALTNLFDPDYNTTRIFGLSGTPAALLLGADGLMAGGPVVGSEGVIDFVEMVNEQLNGVQIEGEFEEVGDAE